MNGNGDPNDEIPMSIMAEHIPYMFGPAFGLDLVSGFYADDNGQVHYAYGESEQYKAYLEFLNGLFQEGLLAVSYTHLLIILLCLVAYSGVIVYETAALKREQAEQFYNMRAETVASALDEQLMDAQNLITSVNSSIIVNTLYRQAVGEDSVDPYTCLLYTSRCV